MDTSVIPIGPYCYDQNGACPYWSIVPDAPAQYNGYCSFLGKSDIDISREEDVTITYSKNKEDIGKTMKAIDAPIPISLLWDKCKECRINDEWDDE